MSDEVDWIECWNRIFTFKIKESDIQRPTENFVFRVLISYLEKFNMDVASMINLNSSPNSEIRRKFKIKFCAYIDHFHKVSCPEHNFLYYDLIKPAPNKTRHMLNVFLNYYSYYIQLQNETIFEAQSKIDELHKLLDERNNLQLELQANQLRVKEIETESTKNDDMLSKINEQQEHFDMKEKDQQQKINQLKDTIKNYDAVLCQLKSKEKDLKEDIVSEKEIELLTTSKSMLEKAISEQEDIKKVTIANSDDRQKEIKQMEPAIEKIEAATKTYFIDEIINPLKDMKLKLQKVTQEYVTQEAVNEKKRTIIKGNEEIIRRYKKELLEKKYILRGINEKFNDELARGKRNMETEEAIYKSLKSEVEALELTLEEEERLGTNLVSSAITIADILNSNN